MSLVAVVLAGLLQPDRMAVMDSLAQLLHIPLPAVVEEEATMDKRVIMEVLAEAVVQTMAPAVQAILQVQPLHKEIMAVLLPPIHRPVVAEVVGDLPQLVELLPVQWVVLEAQEH